jgi:hypothetical protein
MMRTVYTCITNNYDDLKEPINSPPHHHQHWKFICYTDNPNIRVINAMEEPVTNTQWEIRPLVFHAETPAKTARWHKINFHKVTDTPQSLWVDATFFINIDLNRWWKRFKAPFTAILHPFDICAYKDIRSCLGGGKGDWHKLMNQAADYMKEGLPEDHGLIASGILMRENRPDVKRFCEQWWEQIDKYTERDQPCFTYVAWKNPGIIDTIQWNYTTAEEFIHVPHIHKQKVRDIRFKQIIKKL